MSSTADWQGRLLAFHKLDQAFENDKCRNSDTDFQRDDSFLYNIARGLVLSNSY